MVCEGIAEKKRLIGYSNPRKAFNPEPTTPCFALAVFGEVGSNSQGKLYLQSINGGRIINFDLIGLRSAVIDPADKEILLGVGDIAVIGFDFSYRDKVRGSIREVAVVVQERLSEILPHKGIREDVLQFLKDEAFLGKSM